MIVRLKTFARFRDLLGRELEVDLEEGSTVADLLTELLGRSEDLGDLLFEADRSDEVSGEDEDSGGASDEGKGPGEGSSVGAGAGAVTGTGAIRDEVNIMVNGRHIESLEGPNTELKEGDEVALFPAVVGG